MGFAGAESKQGKADAVAKKEKPTWTKIRGKYYDVRHFKHPGGNVIDLFLGMGKFGGHLSDKFEPPSGTRGSPCSPTSGRGRADAVHYGVGLVTGWWPPLPRSWPPPKTDNRRAMAAEAYPTTRAYLKRPPTHLSTATDGTSGFDSFHGHNKKAETILRALPVMKTVPENVPKQAEGHPEEVRFIACFTWRTRHTWKAVRNRERLQSPSSVEPRCTATVRRPCGEAGQATVDHPLAPAHPTTRTPPPT